MNKIYFDIRLRPEIESGKYKVLFADRPARIICWDKKSSKDGSTVVALVDDGKSEHTEYFYADGNSICVNSPALFIVPVDSEPTAFESRLCEILDFAWKHKDTIKTDVDIIADAKRLGPELLDLARKELQPEIDAEVEKAYKNADRMQYEKGKEDADRMQYEKGKEDALKDLPRWRTSALDFEHGVIGETIDGRDVLSYKGYEIILEDILDKLPKEDEK